MRFSYDLGHHFLDSIHFHPVAVGFSKVQCQGSSFLLGGSSMDSDASRDGWDGCYNVSVTVNPRGNTMAHMISFDVPWSHGSRCGIHLFFLCMLIMFCDVWIWSRMWYPKKCWWDSWMRSTLLTILSHSRWKSLSLQRIPIPKIENWMQISRLFTYIYIC